MTPRFRILGFGSTTVLVLGGVACGLLVGGLTGEVLLIALILIGVGGALLLVFLEVGVSEDREREDEERRRRKRTAQRTDAPRRRRLPRRARRPG